MSEMIIVTLYHNGKPEGEYLFDETDVACQFEHLLCKEGKDSDNVTTARRALCDNRGKGSPWVAATRVHFGKEFDGEFHAVDCGGGGIFFGASPKFIGKSRWANCQLICKSISEAYKHVGRIADRLNSGDSVEDIAKDYQ